jgi:hypothetical protein
MRDLGWLELALIDVMPSKGSHLSLVCDTDEPIDLLDIVKVGHGRLSVSSAECKDLYFYSENGTLDLDGLDTKENYYYWDIENTNLSMTGCHLEVRDLSFDLENSTVRLQDCAVTASHPVELEWHQSGACSIELEGCMFEGVTQLLSPTRSLPFGTDLTIRDSYFQGKDTFIILGEREVGLGVLTAPGIDLTVSGNTFTGPYSGIIGHPDIVASIDDPNVFEDGAGIYAWIFEWVEAKKMEGDYDGWFSVNFVDDSQYINPYIRDRLLDILWSYTDVCDRSALFDVTQDPSKAKEITVTWVVIFDRGYEGDDVVWFEKIDLYTEPEIVWIPEWPSLYPYIDKMRASLADQENFWEP